MKVYWDTSAAINAFFSPVVADRLKTGEHVTRLHTCSEFFSIMTGSGIALKDERGQIWEVTLAPGDAVKWLRRFLRNVELAELDGSQLLDGLEKAESRKVSGQGVYDYGHFLTAATAGANKILTRDVGDFQRLAAGSSIKVEWP